MISKMTTPAGTNTIIGEPANINYFLKTPLEPDSAASVQNKQTTVKAHTRRRYFNDTAPSNVSAATRDYLFDPGRRNGNALPGNPFILDDGVEKRQFQYTGTFIDLHAFFVGEAKQSLTLYSQSATYSIVVSAENAG